MQNICWKTFLKFNSLTLVANNGFFIKMYIGRFTMLMDIHKNFDVNIIMRKGGGSVLTLNCVMYSIKCRGQ